MHPAQLIHRNGVRRVSQLRLARLRQADLLEQHVRQLLRRTDVELVPDFGVDLAFYLLQLALHLARHVDELRRIDGDADELHPREHRHQRHLDVVEERPEVP